jgi:methionyl-tRNA formyltransferase
MYQVRGSSVRVVAFGYMTWGRRTIEAVLDAGHDVALIVTHPESDNPYEKIFNESVAALAADRSIPVLARDRGFAGWLAVHG